MSDIDDDFMHEDDAEEDYDFEYEEDDEEQEEADVDLENKYYNAKGRKEDDPEGALDEFQQVVAMEGDTKGDWGFKALKQTIKVAFRLGKLSLALDTYKNLLTYVKSSVTRNYAEKSISSILDVVSSSQDMTFLEQFYQLTVQCLLDNKNDRLWVKTQLKLAKLWLDAKEYGRLTRILRQLRDHLAAEEGSEDFQRKGTHSLEVYALEIQLYTETKNNKKLKALYQQCLNVKSAIPHPKVMGVIQDWNKAQEDFFEAFKSYDEAGSPQRIQCLQYLVLTNMLMESQISPFDSQETKPYKNDPQITAMMNLVSAFQRKEIWEFEKILKDHRKEIMGDPFIRMYIEDVLSNIRKQVLLRVIQPYRRIRLDFIAQQLGSGITVKEVEELAVSLILDQKIFGRIDQVNGKLELDRGKQEEAAEQQAIATGAATSASVAAAGSSGQQRKQKEEQWEDVNRKRHEALLQWNRQLLSMMQTILQRCA